MSVAHAIEDALLGAFAAGLRAAPRPRARAFGAAIGDLARRLGLRTAVARANLAIAFPDADPAWREDVLARHYRELGRVAAEYASLPALVQAPPGEVVTEVQGIEHFEAARAAGRGAILLSGHYGHFELLGAYLGRMHPVDFVVRPLSNARVEARLAALRTAAGVGLVPGGASIRRVYEALRAGRFVAMLGDQDARRLGVFVPFFGRPASTAVGPARIAIGAGAPIVMGFTSRTDDGRHRLDIDPPIWPGADKSDAAVERLTARHTARLEEMIRVRPDHWFWLHRRWKTAPPAAASAES